MERIPTTQYTTLFGIIILGLLVYSISVNYPIIIGSFTGNLSVTVGNTTPEVPPEVPNDTTGGGESTGGGGGGGGAVSIINQTPEIPNVTASRELFFDIKIKVLPEYKKVVAGGTLVALVELKNIGLQGEPVDVSLYLSIINSDRKISFEVYKETLAISTQLSLMKEIQIPSNISIGEYLLLSKMKYDSITLEAYDTFSVVEKTEVKIESPALIPSRALPNSRILRIITTLVVIIIISAVFFALQRNQM